MNTTGIVTRARAGMLLLAGMAAALTLVMTEGTPVGAQGTAAVMVSNLEESEGNQLSISAGQQYAQSFCTGDAAVTLAKVRMYTSTHGSNPAPSVTIPSNRSGKTGPTLHTLTNPTIDESIATAEDFTSSGYELAANTPYWLVVHPIWNSSPLTVSITESDDDSSAGAGWFIGDRILIASSNGWINLAEPARHRMRLEVYATDGVSSALPPAFPDLDCSGGADTFTFELDEYVDDNVGDGTAVGTVTATDQDTDSLTYSVSGTDAAAFNQAFAFNTGTGEITVKSGASIDYEAKSSYSITVDVTDGTDDSGAAESPAATDDSVPVTIGVINIDEAGTVTLSTDTPGVGSSLTATLSDLDGVSRVHIWQWSSSASATGTFSNIRRANYAAYTPGAADEGRFLKVTVSYRDPLNPFATVEATSANAVAEAGGL